MTSRDGPAWAPLCRAVGAAGLPFVVLPLGQRYPVAIQLTGYLLISCANDDPRSPTYLPPKK